jgi:hypothetical protein
LRVSYNDSVVTVPAIIIWPAPTPAAKEDRISPDVMDEMTMTMTMTVHGHATTTAATLSHSGRAYAHHCNGNWHDERFATHCTHSLKLNYNPTTVCKTPDRVSWITRWRGDFAQSRNVMLATRMLAAAIIKISEPSKLLKTCNIGTSRCPNTHRYRSPTKEELSR